MEVKERTMTAKESGNKGYTVLLVDDHEWVRDALRARIEDEPGLRVIDEAQSGRQAIQLYKQHRPDIIIMDIRMYDLNGLQATRRICELDSQAKIIAISITCDASVVREILDSGASAFVSKASAFRELGEALNRVAKGELFVTTEAIDVLAADSIRDVLASATTFDLTPSQRELLRMAADGEGARDIAERLGVNRQVMDEFRKDIISILDVQQFSRATRYAVREGLSRL